MALNSGGVDEAENLAVRGLGSRVEVDAVAGVGEDRSARQVLVGDGEELLDGLAGEIGAVAVGAAEREDEVLGAEHDLDGLGVVVGGGTELGEGEVSALGDGLLGAAGEGAGSLGDELGVAARREAQSRLSDMNERLVRVLHIAGILTRS